MIGLQHSKAACRAAQRPNAALSRIVLGALVTLAVALAWASSARANTEMRKEIQCLALNIYHEARGEPELGRQAVGHVVLNRVADARFPGSVCDVVQQGGEERRLRCQFTWWCDGRSDKPEDLQAWERSKAMARSVFWGFLDDPTDGSLWYHANYVKPAWRKRLVKAARIGSHLFYNGAPSAKVQASAR